MLMEWLEPSEETAGEEETTETPVVEAPKTNYALATKAPKKGFDENEFDELFNK
jgi:hypothetical protein